MLDIYRILTYKKFIKKIRLTKYMPPLTNEIQNNKINDNLIKYFSQSLENKNFILFKSFICAILNM